MNKILETIDFEIYKLNEKYKMDYAYSDPRTNETLVALTTLENLRGQLEPLVSQENGGFNIHTSKEEYEEEGETKICYIAHSTFLGKYSCHAEGETRLEAVKKYLEESLEFIKFLETEGHGKKLNEELEITERKW